MKPKRILNPDFFTQEDLEAWAAAWLDKVKDSLTSDTFRALREGGY